MAETVRLHYNSFSTLVPIICTPPESTPSPGDKLYVQASTRAYLHGHPVGLACKEGQSGAQCLGIVAPEVMQPRPPQEIHTMNIRVRLISVVISGAVMMDTKLLVVSPGRDVQTFDHM